MRSAFSKLESDLISDVASDSSVFRSSPRKDEYLDINRSQMKNQQQFRLNLTPSKPTNIIRAGSTQNFPSESNDMLKSPFIKRPDLTRNMSLNKSVNFSSRDLTQPLIPELKLS